jgi:predicted glycogen debranching enzyme
MEWMIGNGNGGFAMACVNQMLTRRYHGLLVAAIDPPLERFVLLSKLDATVVIDGLTYELATNDYPEAVHPQGFKLLEFFSLRPYPTWRWRAGRALIEQTLCMVDGEDTTFVQYRLIDGPDSVAITIRPLCTSRHFHVLASKTDIGWATVEEEADRLEFHWGGDRPGWQLSHNGTFKSRGDWYYQFVLDAERARGYDYLEDLFMPGPVTATLTRGDSVGLVFAASTRNRPWKHWQSAFERAAARDETPKQLNEDNALEKVLSRAAGDFIVSRQGDLKTVIAGYPWFGDWGRDTFISLPGLCLVPGRYDEARSILETFSNYIDAGMIPNSFPDFGKPPSYNTADAALWYIHAMDRYLTYSNDWPFIKSKMLPAISSILDAHERGTRHGIRLAQDGLLCAGEPGLALTWMDARVNDHAMTPRIGKPVEVNALWHNALEIAARLFERAGEANRGEYWRRLASKAKSAFNQRFWHEAGGYLCDVVDPDGQSGAVDASLRPNQLLAISLTYPVLDTHRWAAVVEACEKNLLTPMGLRSLAPGSPGYSPRYQGNVEQRDSAYHQGTVWPWLLGPFVTAYVRTHGDSPRVFSAAHGFLDGLTNHLLDGGIGSVSEVADAEPPHTPGGCPWQAWSVAEPLRALCEDVLRTHPAKIASSQAPVMTPRQPVA